MTTKYQNFEGYADGASVPSDFDSTGGDTNATFWIINGTVTAASAAALDGTRGGRVTASNNAQAITRAYTGTAGVRSAASLLFRLSADTFTAGDTVAVAQLYGHYRVGTLANGNVAWQYTPSAGGLTTIDTGVPAVAGRVYLARFAITAPGSSTASGRLEASLVTVTAGVSTAVYSYDSGPTLALAATLGPVLIWGNVTGSSSGSTAKTLTVDFDDVAWSNDLTSGFPGYQPTFPPPTLAVTAAPTIVGTPQVGLTLTASSGTWAPAPDGFGYQWNRAGQPITGATAGTYTVDPADVGQPITVTVTATKSGYPTASATSASVTGIAAPVPAPVIAGSGALRRWFIGSDDYWRAYGIDTPVYAGPDSTVTARFTVNTAGKTITVDAATSTATPSTITGYSWDFGDGATATGAKTTHTYTSSGSFTIVLTVTDDRNTTATVQQTVTMSAPNAAFTWTATGLAASFDASGSTDVGSTIRSYGWDFGDGTTGTGPTVTHTYATAGTRAVVLTVTDTAGVTDTDSQQVSIALPVSNPVAAFTVAVSNSVASFDLSASSTTNATITRFDLTFGDGTSWTGLSRTVTHPYAVGTWTATLKVTDSQGHTATVSHPVAVAAPPNQPPTAAFTATPSGLKVGFSAVTSSDGDGTITGYAWTYGDGGTGTGVSPTHDYTASGSYTVRLTVTDNLGATGTTTKTLTVTAPSTDIEYLASTTATKSSTLVPSSTAAVTQHFTRSVDTGEFYSSQAHKETDGVTESVRLSRLRTDGTLLDQMFLSYAGHGSMFELEYVNKVMYIYLTWQRNTLGGAVVDDWVRFPYKAGTFTRSQVTGLTVKIAGPTYRLIAFDREAGYACVRTSSSTSETFRRYPLANVLAGNLTGQVGKTITLPMSPPTAQGFATYYDSVFRYMGAPTDDPNWATDKPTLTEHSWTSGNTVRTLDMTSYLGTGRGEPESVAVYNTGSNPVLFFGFSYGPVGGPHTYPTWWFPLKDQTTTPPPPPSGAGDSGINQTGIAGKQQTGTGVKDYSTLTGSTVGTKINAAGSGNIASMPAGTFTLTNFKEAWGGTANGSLCIAGASVNAGIKGLYGAGSASTKIVLPTGTPPALESGATTNQHYLMAFKNPVTSGFIIDGVTLQGVTADTNDFGGIWTQGSTNLTISNATIKGVVGSAGAPPGETFVFNLYSHASGTANFSHVTFEGSNLAAAGLGTNSTSGTINIDNCVASNFAYSAGIATWENRGTINVRGLRMAKNHRNFGAETNAGTINVTNPIWGDHASGGHDFNVTWTNNYGDGFINVYFTTATDWQNFIGPRTVKKITVVTNTHQVYGGSAGGAYTGSGDIWKNFRVYVGGVQQTTTNYVTFTGNHVA